MEKQIANAIFFLRNEELRIPELDPHYVFSKQLKLVNEYNFPATFLLQYDTLIDERYVLDLKSKANSKCEIGAWLEIVRPLSEKAGITWRGRKELNWDWHSHCGFLVGYTKEERKALIDVYMADFFEAFGYYPKTVACWMIDAYSLKYLETEYGVVASTNCREQWGTDGYTLWGGFYGPCYYPSKNNALCPAQTYENQVNIPVFRFWSTDYLHQYDYYIDLENKTYDLKDTSSCITFEPAINGARLSYGGQNTKWSDWYIDEILHDNPFGFNYIAFGQENTFLWEAQRQGLRYHFKRFKDLSEKGKVKLLTLSETAKLYMAENKVTAPQIQRIETDWRENFNCKTLWYNCKNYRCNLYIDNDKLWFRDIYKFDEAYEESCAHTVCTTNEYCFDTLPVVDGFIWCGDGVRSGLYIDLVNGQQSESLTVSSYEIKYHDEKSIEFICKTPQNNIVKILLNEEKISISCETAKINMSLIYAPNKNVPFKKFENGILYMEHKNFEYEVKIVGADIKIDGNILISGENKVEFIFQK